MAAYKIKKQKKISSFEACRATQRPKYVLSWILLKLVIVVGCGPTKPFKICEGNQEEWLPPLNLRQRSRR